VSAHTCVKAQLAYAKYTKKVFNNCIVDKLKTLNMCDTIPTCTSHCHQPSKYTANLGRQMEFENLDDAWPTTVTTC
jgi:hypothetical protein